jgi:YVTN family beta-propeller protein
LRHARLLLALLAACLLLPSQSIADTPDRAQPGLSPSKNLLFNGWGLTPAGEPIPVSDLPLKMVVSPDGRVLAAVSGGFSNTGLTLIDLSRKTTQFLPMKKAFNGLAFSKDGKRIFVSGGNSGEIHVFSYADGVATDEKIVTPVAVTDSVFIAGFAVHPTTGKLYVCNEGNHEVWVLNADTLALECAIPVGFHPHSCVFGADKRHLYVSNWGSRNVSVVDTKTNRRVRDIGVGVRPNDMALSGDGRLFVACAGDNTVYVIKTRSVEKADPAMTAAAPPTESTREILCTSLYPESPEGSTPDAVAVSPDGKTLFVANADNNDVMVADIGGKEHPESLVSGFIPTGWYPSALAVSPDGKTLFVGNGKGSSRANYPRLDVSKRTSPTAHDYIPTCYDASVSMIVQPTAKQMAAYTEQVRDNCPFKPEYMRQAPMKSQSIILDQAGKPCPIKHVLYIIKENRTYDQVMGDFTDASGKRAGNGDPNIVMYGEPITPNHHQIARDYVLLDNLYCNGEVSADGHSWCDAAMATDFRERSWMMGYSHRGNLPGNDEMATPAAGNLWDLCRRNGVSYRNYGEGSGRVPTADRGKWAGWGGRDMNSVDTWIADLHAAEKSGSLPAFTIMSLPEDHTQGAKPGARKPEACVASNDIGLGKILAAASRGKFWKEMAIFVIEDDAQGGPDHVDAHRTIGFVISPWCKRGFIDSTLYTTASMVRTMELILGLPALTQYDAGATPMFNSFGTKATLTPYNVLKPKVDLNAKNTVKTPGAKASAKMDFSDYDRAPEDELNRVLWRLAKGPDIPYPAPIHRAVFAR